MIPIEGRRYRADIVKHDEQTTATIGDWVIKNWLRLAEGSETVTTGEIQQIGRYETVPDAELGIRLHLQASPDQDTSQIQITTISKAGTPISTMAWSTFCRMIAHRSDAWPDIRIGDIRYNHDKGMVARVERILPEHSDIVVAPATDSTGEVFSDSKELFKLYEFARDFWPVRHRLGEQRRRVPAGAIAADTYVIIYDQIWRKLSEAEHMEHDDACYIASAENGKVVRLSATRLARPIAPEHVHERQTICRLCTKQIDISRAEILMSLPRQQPGAVCRTHVSFCRDPWTTPTT